MYASIVVTFINCCASGARELMNASLSNKQTNKLFWWLYFIISQRFAHLFKWASSGQCFQSQNLAMFGNVLWLKVNVQSQNNFNHKTVVTKQLFCDWRTFFRAMFSITKRIIIIIDYCALYRSRTKTHCDVISWRNLPKTVTEPWGSCIARITKVSSTHTWKSAEIFAGRTRSTLCLSFSSCWVQMIGLPDAFCKNTGHFANSLSNARLTVRLLRL